MASRNPAWTRDELILALDLYFRLGRKHEGPTHPEVVKTSSALNALPSSKERGADDRFRNPAGVAMKLANYLSADPEYQGTGLARGNKMEKEIWDEYAPDPRRLRQTAAAILMGATEVEGAELPDDEEQFPEGGVLTLMHNRRERAGNAPRRKKHAVLKATGRLECEACGFDFSKAYGDLGAGFAECHHVLPLSELPSRKTTRLSDLAILCANCHRMIHRTRPVMSVAQFRDTYCSKDWTP